MVEVIIPSPNTKKIDLVGNNHSESLSWLQSSGYLQEWQDWNDLYRSIPDAKPAAWMSNKFIPITNSKVETAYSSLQALLFSANPFFQVRPRELTDKESAKIIQKLLMYQFDEANVPYEFMQYLRSLCINGTSIAMICWDRKFDNRTIVKEKFEPIRDVFGRQVGQQSLGVFPENEKYLSFDGPRLINQNLADCFPEPTSVEIQDGWIVVRSYKSLDWLREMHKNYPDTYNAEVMKLTDEDGTNNKKAADETQANNNRLNNASISRAEGNARIEVMTRWGMDVDVDGVLKQRVLATAAGKYLVRDTNNPYWHGKIPYIKSNYIPVQNEFYGIGIPELGEDLQTIINETVNQKNDNISLALNRMIVYLKNRGVDIKKLRSEPGLRIGVEGERLDDVIKFLDIPLNTRDASVFTAEAEKWMQEVTAVTKLTMGLEMSAQDTATGLSILQRASGNRFMAIARTIEKQAFKEMITMFYQLDYQYITVNKVVRIVGPQGNTWVAVSPEEVRRDYDFVPAGIFTLENKAQTALKCIQFKQVTKDDPTVKQSALNRKIYDALEIGDNPDEIMFNDSEMQDIMQSAKMIAVQMVNKIMSQQGMKTPGPGQGKGGGGANSSSAMAGSVLGSAQVPPPTPPGAGQPPQM
jgi:hypothetical protein